MRLFVISVSLVMLIAHGVRAEDRGLAVFAAGSLREAFGAIAQDFGATHKIQARTEFGPSGRMRELWSHLRLGDWSSVVPHTFLLLPREVDGLVGIPLTEPDASRSIGLVASGRDPLPSVTVGGVQALADDSVGAPRLRGVARTGKHSSGAFVWELYQTGLTDLWISTRPWKPPGPGQTSLILYHAEILAAVANTLSVLDHFRGYVGAPDAEYGMEIGDRAIQFIR